VKEIFAHNQALACCYKQRAFGGFSIKVATAYVRTWPDACLSTSTIVAPAQWATA
jgi:hypothetical protein